MNIVAAQVLLLDFILIDVDGLATSVKVHDVIQETLHLKPQLLATIVSFDFRKLALVQRQQVCPYLLEVNYYVRANWRCQEHWLSIYDFDLGVHGVEWRGVV